MKVFLATNQTTKLTTEYDETDVLPAKVDFKQILFLYKDQQNNSSRNYMLDLYNTKPFWTVADYIKILIVSVVIGWKELSNDILEKIKWQKAISKDEIKLILDYSNLFSAKFDQYIKELENTNIYDSTKTDWYYIESRERKPGWTQAVLRVIALGKKLSNGEYSVEILGSKGNGRVLDRPLFASESQAIAFIAEIKNGKAQTRRPVDDLQNLMEYSIKKLTETSNLVKTYGVFMNSKRVEVDTTCGKAYIDIHSNNYLESVENNMEKEKLNETLDYFEQERKMMLWHNGQRDQARTISKMGDDKLKMNYEICVKHGYTKEANLLKIEGKARNAAWALKVPYFVLNTNDFEYLNPTLKVNFYDEMIMHRKNIPEYLSKYIVGSTDEYVARKLTMLLAIAIVAKLPDYIDEIKKALATRNIDTDVVKAALKSCISNKEILDVISMQISGKKFNEAVEKHDTLNPKLWNEDNTLKSEVNEKINLIVDTFVKGLAEDGIKIKIDDVVIIGSNCSYNYNEGSDLDIHIKANTKDLECPEELYELLYSAYRSLFNKKFNIEFYDIPVELYVETESLPTVSNGIYSVLNKKWIKEPVQQNIPEVNNDEIQKLVGEWMIKYNKVVEERNIDSIDKFIEEVYDLRKESLAKGEEYGTPNLVFKELRNAGCLDNLKELKNEIKSKAMSLESLHESIVRDNVENSAFDIQKRFIDLDSMKFRTAKTDEELIDRAVAESMINNLLININDLANCCTMMTSEDVFKYIQDKYNKDLVMIDYELTGNVCWNENISKEFEKRDEKEKQDVSKFMNNLEIQINESINKKSKITKENIEKIINKYNDEKKSKIHLGENTSGDSKWCTIHYDDGDVDFSKLIIKEPTEDSNWVAAFMIYGGLNGRGDWKNYFNDLKKLTIDFDKELNCAFEIEKIENDICDDIWTAYCFLYPYQNLEESLLHLTEHFNRAVLNEDLIFEDTSNKYADTDTDDLWSEDPYGDESLNDFIELTNEDIKMILDIFYANEWIDGIKNEDQVKMIAHARIDKNFYAVKMSNSNSTLIGMLEDNLKSLIEKGISFDRESNDEGFYGKNYLFYKFKNNESLTEDLIFDYTKEDAEKLFKLCQEETDKTKAKYLRNALDKCLYELYSDLHQTDKEWCEGRWKEITDWEKANPLDSECETNESLFEDLDEKARNKYRIALTRAAFGNQPVIQQNGMFNIYNVKESEVQTIINKIKELNFIEYVNEIASRYDFSKPVLPGQLPSRYHDISGKIKN